MKKNASKISTAPDVRKHAGAVTATSGQLYRNSGSFGNDLTISVLPVARDNCKDVSFFTHERMMQFGRLLYVNVPFIGGVIDEMAMYAVGDAWQPKFIGADKAWGKLAQERLAIWTDQCDLRGQPFNWSNDWRLAIIAAVRDGDLLMVKTFSETSGFKYPKLQFIPAHRIKSSDYSQGMYSTGTDDGKGIIASGPYKGMKSYNGVVFNEYDTAIAYQIRVTDNPKDDVFIPAGSAHLIYSPLWSDQARGQTALHRCIQEMVGVDHITDLETFAARLFAMQTLVEKVESDGEEGIGANFLKEDSAGNPINSAADGALVEDFKVGGGIIRKLRAGSGTSVTAFEQNRPTPNLMAFRRELMRASYSSLNWPMEFSYDTKELGSGTARLVMSKIGRTVGHLQGMIWPMAAAAIRHAVRFYISIGLLPENTEWYKWDFNYPKLPTIDAGREAQQIREDYKLGLTNLKRIYGDQSEDWESEILQRIEEQKFVDAQCKLAGVNPDKIQLFTPNGNPQTTAPNPPPAEE